MVILGAGGTSGGVIPQQPQQQQMIVDHQSQINMSHGFFKFFLKVLTLKKCRNAIEN